MNTNKRQPLAAVFILATLVLALALPAPALADDAKQFSRTVDLKSGGRLTLKTYKGSIRLTPWDREQVKIVARIEPGNDVSRRYAQESVEATRIRVRGSGNSVRIESDYDDVPCKHGFSFLGIINTGCSKTLPYVHYEIRAPRRLTLWLKDYKSEIALRGFDGDLELETYKGTVEAENLSGEFRLDTYKGAARLDGLRGALNIETYKGDVRIRSAEVNGRSRIETYKGTVSLSVPDSQKLTIRADIGRRGDFHSDFALTTRAWNRKRLEGTINGGGPVLSLETYKGEIRLRRR